MILFLCLGFAKVMQKSSFSLCFKLAANTFIFGDSYLKDTLVLPEFLLIILIWSALYDRLKLLINYSEMHIQSVISPHLLWCISYTVFTVIQYNDKIAKYQLSLWTQNTVDADFATQTEWRSISGQSNCPYRPLAIFKNWNSEFYKENELHMESMASKLDEQMESLRQKQKKFQKKVIEGTGFINFI